MKESEIMREVQIALTQAGARVFRNQVGRYQLKDGRWIASGLCVGSADLIGWSKLGKFLSVEIKTQTGQLSKEQTCFLDAVNKSGGIAFVARSKEEALNLLKQRE
jgi:hypothetical protein